jgi:hypothetical protein
MFGCYERLRLARYFPASIRKRLREEKADFHLVQLSQGAWQFLPADVAKHKVTGRRDESDLWMVRNRFAAQPLRLRIEALDSVEPYDTPQAPILADFSRSQEFAAREAAAGVRHELLPSREQVIPGAGSGRYRANNPRPSRQGAWTKAGKQFSPEFNFSNYDAMGVWIHGDGKGELLNLQLENRPEYWPVRDEHYVKIDFQGWRYFELLLRERDAESCADYLWPYGPVDHYAIYRSPLVRGHVSGLNVYFNELPARGEATCHLSPIKALKAVKTKLRDPAIEIGGRRVSFPVTLESGSCLEWTSAGDCKHLDERGALVAEVKPQGEIPVLAAGDNRLKFTWDGAPEPAIRAQITTISYGDPLLGL